MIDNKMIEYQRRIARINNKIKILSDNGYNVDNYNLTIQSIIDSCNNNVTTIEQGNAQVQIKNMNARTREIFVGKKVAEGHGS